MDTNYRRLTLSRIRTEFSRGTEPTEAVAIIKTMLERQVQADQSLKTRQDVINAKPVSAPF